MTIICYCSNVSEEEIIDAINNGARNLPDIKRMTGACTIGNCKEFHPKGTWCAKDILKLLEKYKKKIN